jgi:hypothetical protein
MIKYHIEELQNKLLRDKLLKENALNKACPFCGAVPIIYDASGDLKITHKTSCFIKDETWIVGERKKNMWNIRSEKKSQITPEEQEKILKKVLNQTREILRQTKPVSFLTIKATCPDCGKKRTMINLYRCFCCGLYICKKCAPKHFNIDPDEIPKYFSKESHEI